MFIMCLLYFSIADDYIMIRNAIDKILAMQKICLLSLPSNRITHRIDQYLDMEQQKGKLWRKFNNWYVYLTLIFFVIFLFTDRNNLFNQIKLYRTLRNQKRQLEFYKEEIAKNKELLKDLETDTALMEKFAREEFKMKRDGEVIYIVEHE